MRGRVTRRERNGLPESFVTADSGTAPKRAETDELIRLVAENLWRLKRCSKVDAELFQMYGKYEGQDRGVGTAFAQDATHGNAFSKLARYRASYFRELIATMKLLEGLGKTSKAVAADRDTLP